MMPLVVTLAIIAAVAVASFAVGYFVAHIVGPDDKAARTEVDRLVAAAVAARDFRPDARGRHARACQEILVYCVVKRTLSKTAPHVSLRVGPQGTCQKVSRRSRGQYHQGHVFDDCSPSLPAGATHQRRCGAEIRARMIGPAIAKRGGIT